MTFKKLLLLTTIATGWASLAHAQTVDDPLHGFCSGVGQCVDNGVNSPTSTNPPASFGFTLSPAPKSPVPGDLSIEILMPSDQAQVTNFVINGVNSSGPSATPWSSGDLDAFLGISASPTNPIGAFLDASETFLDPSATGFDVYRVDLGTQNLTGDPATSPSFNFASGETLDPGSYVVAFFNEGTADKPKWVATANSGAILETNGVPPSDIPLPEPGPLAVGGLSLVWMWYARRRRIAG